MALLWFNIKTKEVIVADSGPMIAAFFNSSNMSLNAHQGQDFGWRPHPEVVIKMRGIKSDPRTLETIALRYRQSLEDIDDKMILRYISDTDGRAVINEKTRESFEDEYRADIERLEAAHRQAEREQKQLEAKARHDELAAEVAAATTSKKTAK